MKRIGPVATALLAIGALLVLFALPVLGQEDGDSGTGSTTTTISASSGLVPAVEIADQSPAEAQADWTYRYLVPTGLVLAVLVALLTSIRYFTNVVRKRYRIVQE